MADTHDIHAIPQAPTVQEGTLRPVLWLVLVVGAVLNVLTSAFVDNVFVGIGFGLITLVGIVALVAHHYHHRPSR
jgi:hypothetical protein